MIRKNMWKLYIYHEESGVLTIPGHLQLPQLSQESKYSGKIYTAL